MAHCSRWCWQDLFHWIDCYRKKGMHTTDSSSGVAILPALHYFITTDIRWLTLNFRSWRVLARLWSEWHSSCEYPWFQWNSSLTGTSGGNDPAIVCKSADVKTMAPAVATFAFLNSGQVRTTHTDGSAWKKISLVDIMLTRNVNVDLPRSEANLYPRIHLWRIPWCYGRTY